MKVGDGEGSKSLVVLGRDPVFQEGHVFLLKEVEGDAIVFNILDMADDGDKASLHFDSLKSKQTQFWSVGNVD